ncbi:MAG: PAS domain S-box protein [Planctomycetota bacterium]|nr:PAS domain S-box protein [Planctomycetota bacterium]
MARDAHHAPQSSTATLPVADAGSHDQRRPHPAFFWTTDGTGAGESFSRTWQDFTGQAPAQAVGAGWLACVHVQDRAEVERVVRDAHARREPFTAEFRVRRRDGEYRRVHGVGHPTLAPGRTGFAVVAFEVHDADDAPDASGADTPRGLTESGTPADDATERRIDERFRLAAQAVNGIIYDYDLRTGLVERSRGLREVLGYEESDVPSTAAWWYAQVHPDDVARVRREIEETTGSACTVEYRVRHRDGRWLRLQDRCVISRDASGAAARVVGCTVDVTDQHRATQELLASETILRAFYEHSPVCMGVTEPLEHDVLHLYDNAATCRFFGLKAGSTMNKLALRDLGASPEITRLWLEHYRASAARGEPVHFEHQFDGGEETRWLSVTVSPLGKGPSGRERFCYLAEDTTERKRAERALLEREHQLRVMTDGTPALIAYIDTERRYRFVNRQYERWFGILREQTLGRTMVEVLGPGPASVLEPHVEAALRGEPTHFETRIVYRGQEPRWINAQYVPDRAPDGRVRGFFALVVDVTDSKFAEMRLRESEERFRTLADNINQFAWMADESGSVFWYNKRWYDFTGTTLEQMQGWGWRTVHHPDHVGRVVEKFTDHIRRGVAWEDVFPLRSSAGEYRWFLSRAHPIRDADGGVTLWFGTNTDITSHREAEQALRDSEERNRALLSVVTDVPWVTDPDGNFIVPQTAWENYTGQSWEQHRGFGRLEAFHPDDRAAVRAAWERARDSKSVYGARARLWHAASQRYRVNMARGMALLRPDGGVREWVGSCTDIDDQARAEDRLRRAVEDATAELERSHRRLRMSERMASLGTLAAGLGHDMGNLLVPIRVRLESFESFDLPAEARQELAGIRGGVSYLQKLASGLRLLASEPAAVPTTRATELHAWWSEASPVLKSTLPRGVTLEGEFPQGECWVQIHHAALMQAVFNLVQNAGEAMRDATSGEVRVLASQRDDEILLAVSDTGPGMSEDVLARCMEPFFSTKTRDVSTGLGLALVHGLVKQAGGVVELVSALGRGTTFTLRLKPGLPDVPAVPVGRRRRACVDIRDARLRAIITADLRHLAFDIEPSARSEADLVITDAPPADVPPGVPTIALVEPGEAPAGCIAIGLRPRVEVIREAIRRGANGAPRAVAPPVPSAPGGAP